MKSLLRLLPNFVIATGLLCWLLLPVPVAQCAENADWQLVRSMTDTFDGPDVGDTWGQLLLMSVDFADAEHGVIGGSNDATELRHNGDTEGMLGYTTDGGRTFKIIKARKNVWGVGHAAGDTFWAAGRGLLKRTDDAGQTWKNVGGASSGMVGTQFDFRDADNGLVGLGGLYRIANGEPSKLETPVNDLCAVAMGDGGFGLAAGKHGRILITNDGGETWTFPEGWQNNANKVYNYFQSVAAAGNRGWAAGDNGMVVRITDAGKATEISHIPGGVPEVPGTALLGGEYLTRICFADARRGWVLGTHYVYRTEDAGETWQMQPTAGGVGMWGMCILDADTAWIAGHYGCIQHTTDGGKTWETLNDYTDLYAVVMVDDRIGYAGAESGGILKTTDGGKTWSFLHSLRGHAVEAMQFLDAKTGWVVGDFGHVARTTDGGKTWSRARNPFHGILKDVHFFNTTRGLAVGERGAILESTDGGKTWKPIPSPTKEMLYAIDFPTAEVGYACGKAVVLKTTDGGNSWVKLESPTKDDILSDVRFTDESHGLMVGDIGMAFVTSDGGRTWESAGTPTIEWLHRIEVVDPNTFLVAGSRGTILRSTDGGRTWAKMTTASRNNVYAISGRVAVGRWGQIQILDPDADVKEPTAGDKTVDVSDIIPEPVWNPLPQDVARGSCTIDERGRLTEITVNGRTFPTSKEFPSFKILLMEDGRPTEIKDMKPDDESWTITPVDSAASGLPENERAFIFDSDYCSVRVSYTALPDRLRVRVKVLEEDKGRVINVSAGAQFIRLMGDRPDVVRKGGLVVPVDGGEFIPFTGFTGYREELNKWNWPGGWTFKNRMIALVDGAGGVILRPNRWHSLYLYGQSFIEQDPFSLSFLYMGWATDARQSGEWSIQAALKDGRWNEKVPDWLNEPPPLNDFGFDLQYVGDVNGDGDVNWVDAGVTYRDGNFPRSPMIDRSPGMCDDFNQTQVSHNWGYILWSSPYIGNTHSDTRAHRHGADGRPSHEWGHFSRSVPYETASGRMARYFDKQADEFNFPPMPAFIGADTWTCGLGGGDGTAGHLATGEEGTQAKIEVLKLLGRRGYLTHSEALSGWGLDGNYFFGWWTPYFGGGAWLAGFSRCWQYSSTAPSGPRTSHLFSKPIPLQAVIFQGMCYYGTGARGPVGYSILHGCRPGPGGSPGRRDDEFFYYPWMVLWKIISPHRVMNARELDDELWEMTYDDGSVLKLDVRANVWVYTKDGITYDGYSPPNPTNGSVKPKPSFWGMRWGNYVGRFAEGSFGVWRNGTFTIRVPGIKAVKPPRVIGAPEKDQSPPAYETEYKRGVLTITIKDKDPIAHPMLIFDPDEQN